MTDIIWKTISVDDEIDTFSSSALYFSLFARQVEMEGHHHNLQGHHKGHILLSPLNEPCMAKPKPLIPRRYYTRGEDMVSFYLQIISSSLNC